MSYMNRYANVTDYVINKMSAAITKDMDDKLAKKLSLSGGTMDKDSEIEIPITKDDRYTKIVGGDITHYLSSTTGYAGGISWLDHSENLLGGIGLFGSNDIPEYYFIGNYSDPLVKVDMEGNTSIKKKLTVSGEIIGTLNGNSATATKATQDSDGNVITDTYAEKKTIVSKSATGASISIADSKEAPMILNYAPVNLFNHSFATTTTKGITFTANANGTITANGTATGNMEVAIGAHTFTDADIGKTFCWSDNGISVNADINWNAYIFLNNINGVSAWRGHYRFVVEKAHTVNIKIYVLKGEVLENKVYRPMLEEGSTYHTYVPYTGYDIASCGKNLIGCIDKPASGTRCTLSWNGDEVTVTATASNAWSGCTIGIKGLKPNTKYTISADLEASTTNIYNGLIFGSDTVARCGYGKSGNVTLTNSTDSNGYIYILFLVDNKLNGVSGDYAIFKNIMLEEGDTASGYEASKSTSVTINSKTVFPVDGLESYDGLTNVLNPYSATMKVIYATNEAGQGILKELKTKAEIDGSNAIGDWDIDITGNSATATCLINSYTYNTRPTSADDFNTFNKMGIMFSSSAMTTNKPSSDGAIVQIGWDNRSSPWINTRQQLFLPHDASGNMQYRGWQGSGTTGAWWAWRTLLDSNNYSKYALPKAGGTMDKDAAIIIPSTEDDRSMKYSCGGITYTTPTSGTYAAGLGYYDQSNTRIGGIGLYGEKGISKYYFVGNYSDPLVKVDMEGNVSIKKALPVASGGTGKTTLADSANALINGLSTGSSTPEDNDYYVSQWAGGEQNTFHRRPVSALWEYIKGKISSVLGLTASSYSGKSATTTKWATARNINGLSVDGTANRVNYGTCSTAAATAAKTVACTGFALVTGAEITVKFTVTNTAASPTLNVNSTGAKAIYYRGAAITAGFLVANRTYTFRYNGTQYELVGDINPKLYTNSYTQNNKTYYTTMIDGNLYPMEDNMYKLGKDLMADGASYGTSSNYWAGVYTNKFYLKGVNNPVMYYDSTTQTTVYTSGVNITPITVTGKTGLKIYSPDNMVLDAGAYLYLKGSTKVSANQFAYSDPSVKEFTNDIDTDSEKLSLLFEQIRVRSYLLKELSSEKVNFGINAEELEELCLELGIDINKYTFLDIEYNYIMPSSNAEDGKFYPKFRNIAYNELFTLAINEVQKLQKKFDDLNSRLTALENK